MVDLWVWVLSGILLYTLAMMAFRTQGWLPSYIRVSGPITTVHTKRGRAFLNWLAAPRRFWRAYGNIGVGIALVTMGAMLVVVLTAALGSLLSPGQTPSEVRNPQNVLVIPGVNEFLPLSAAPGIVFGLLVGLVVHEGGHGLLCRVEDIDIDSMGLAFLAFIPVGAFVEPDEESRSEADRGSQTRMFSAGVMNNFAITVIAFALLFGPVAGSIAVADGAPVGQSLPGSTAEDAGIERGDLITAINGTDVTEPGRLETVLRNTPGRQAAVELNGERTIQVTRSPTITASVPQVIGGRANETGINWSATNPTDVVAVNGTTVSTEREFENAVRNHTVAEVETENGTATFPTGAFVLRVFEDGPLGNTTAPTDQYMIITAIAGERVLGPETLSEVLRDEQPDETVPIETYVLRDGDVEREVYNVTLDPHPDEQGGFVGVAPARGVSGLVVNDFGIKTYPAQDFLGLLQGDDGAFGGLTDGSALGRVFMVLIMPFIGVLQPQIGYNFAGFVPEVANFYTASGLLGGLGGGVLIAANMLFWTAWVNLQLGMFNLVPTFPLDGGHILRTSSEAIVSRLPVEGGRRLTTTVTISISLLMIAGLVLMIFGPQLFAG
ncbi:site-2 protease family protein [Halorientalis sp.]|uniref:site-2 protease family protein n=1 Tax=Halorientalis sp. TaxID=1931229 RepID=UPI00260AD767|nr:site-2 protease family protein [Halorientalis sp.]